LFAKINSLEEAFFLVALEKFDFSPRKRMMNPKKIYLMDTGFSLLSGAFTENRGRRLLKLDDDLDLLLEGEPC
jgi:predicted AAA+ superfamily ATPase